MAISGREGITSKAPGPLRLAKRHDHPCLTHAQARVSFVAPGLGPTLPGHSQSQGFSPPQGADYVQRSFCGTQPVNPSVFPHQSPIPSILFLHGRNSLESMEFQPHLEFSLPSISLLQPGSCILVPSLQSDFLRLVTLSLDLVWAKVGHSGPGPWIVGPSLREWQLVLHKEYLSAPLAPGSLPPLPQSESDWVGFTSSLK